MSLFFMHIADHQGIIVDETGREFDEAEDAVVEATRAASQILVDEMRDATDGVSIKVYVETANKHRVATVSVSGSLTY